WFALGDGGPDHTAQNMTSPLGKMIRIDVNNGSPYSVPSNNPYVNSDPSQVLPEIWAAGFRNPFRFSFDQLTGDIYIADVGQNEFEEINFWNANDHSGANFGWRCYEGPAAYNTTGCSGSSAYDLPIYYHSHIEEWCSVIGGYVYRGTASPSLYGKYIYTDFCLGELHALSPDGSGGNMNSFHRPMVLGRQVLAKIKTGNFGLRIL
ncbi:MAG: PQQ-dependent sugar dehydrogenase, partial [Bacteroidota bacterium]|nr:PQQ-dependent sugar dehydrogenase [Bacteroidota bacterium]